MRSPTPTSLQQVDGALLEHAGAHALLDVLAAAVLEHDRLDAAQVQQVREQQPGGAGADDADLRPLLHSVLLTGYRSWPHADRTSSSSAPGCCWPRPPFAGDNGEGLVGETDDRIITFFCLGLVVVFFVLVTLLTVLQSRAREAQGAAQGDRAAQARRLVAAGDPAQKGRGPVGTGPRARGGICTADAGGRGRPV